METYCSESRESAEADCREGKCSSTLFLSFFCVDADVFSVAEPYVHVVTQEGA